MSEPILFAWSGGKDSAMALHAIRQISQFKIISLLTTVTEGYQRISMHGVRRELLAQQARSLNLPLHEVHIPPQCDNSLYEARMEQSLRHFHEQGVRRVAFGDIFLADLRLYREKNLARLNMTAEFPIWQRDTRDLIRQFHAENFRSIAVCINGKILPRSFAGRELDASFFADLPPTVDPCGENGEFHTFVFNGPIFRSSIKFRKGKVVDRDNFIFCDLLPEAQDVPPDGEARGNPVGAQDTCAPPCPAEDSPQFSGFAPSFNLDRKGKIR